MANIAANTDQKTAVQMGGVARAAPAVIVLSPPTGDATPQTHAFASLTG